MFLRLTGNDNIEILFNGAAFAGIQFDGPYSVVQVSGTPDYDSAVGFAVRLKRPVGGSKGG
jgi:hypothetical protein